MKTTKNRETNHWTILYLIVGIIAIAIILMANVSITTDTGSYVKNSENFVVIEEEPYYSTTKYFYNEDDFIKARQTETKGMSTKKGSKTDYMDEGKEFVAGVIKTVSVAERYDEYGNVVDSRLLTYDEIVETQGAQVFDLTPIGTAREDRYSLDIVLMVTLDTYDNTYDVLGTAEWHSQLVWGGEENPEDSADDFMALTWGGNEELRALEFLFDGYYRDGTDIIGDLCLSDEVAGYCWQFREKTGLWVSAMHLANAEVKLKKTYPEEQGKMTNVKFTYIHSYSYVTPSVEFSVGTSGAAAGIGVTTSGGAWQLQVDVFGLNY